ADTFCCHYVQTNGVAFPQIGTLSGFNQIFVKYGAVRDYIVHLVDEIPWHHIRFIFCGGCFFLRYFQFSLSRGAVITLIVHITHHVGGIDIQQTLGSKNRWFAKFFPEPAAHTSFIFWLSDKIMKPYFPW